MKRSGSDLGTKTGVNIYSVLENIPVTIPYKSSRKLLNVLTIFHGPIPYTCWFLFLPAIHFLPARV
jgi:hypothetical protein